MCIFIATDRSVRNFGALEGNFRPIIQFVPNVARERRVAVRILITKEKKKKNCFLNYKIKL